jgi:predicted phage terminase large subunit-like protein
MDKPIKQSVEHWLNQVDYGDDVNYIPSEFSLEFVNFIKLVNGSDGEENLTPIIHYKMLDQIAGGKANTLNMLFRGSGKTTVFGEYMFLYLATYGELPGFGRVDLALYVSDSIENGVKNMRKNLEFRWENSEFLQQYVPEAKFTDIRWEFTNKDGKRLIIKGYGALTGVRGSKEMGKRPNFALLDDLVSDEGARSPTITASIEDTVYKAIDYALHPTRRKIIWNGTPFNSNDPLYKAAESGAWYVNVFPVCNTFPCAPEEFRGAWEDRFTYQYVKDQYDKAVLAGKVDSFMQELMLRIISDDDRLVFDHDLVWYDSKKVQQNKERYNFYITTDFATSESKASDFSVISVWAYNNNGDWLLVDGICKRQLMDRNVDELFRLVQMYKPQQVGVEVSGQQGGFVSWIYDQMVTRNVYFTLASENNSGKAGIRPATNKMERFNVVLPWFKTKKIWLPEDMRDHPLVLELLQELRYASPKGFKSKHDDAIDTVSMLAKLTPWKPSEETVNAKTGDMFEDEPETSSGAYSSYIV